MKNIVADICFAFTVCFILGCIFYTCDVSDGAYRQNIYEIDTLKISEADKAEIMKKLTDDYASRKKK